MFTVSSPISRAARLKVRALVKNHAGWTAWSASRGIVSGKAKNRELLEYALLHATLAAQVDAIMNAFPCGAVQSDPDMDPDAVNDTDAVESVTDPVDAADADPVEDAPVNADAPVDAPEAPDGAFTVDGILSDVDQFLGAMVRKTLADALAPVVDAANAPPVIVQTGPAPTGPGKIARRGKRVPFKTLFPDPAKDVWRDQLITLWDNADAPAVDPCYIPDHTTVATFLGAFEDGVNGFAGGPGATGKSSMFEYLAARTGRPFVCIGMDGQVEVAAMIGSFVLENGQMVWRDGVLIQAVRQPGTVICIDELTLANPGVQAVLMQLASAQRCYTIRETGETVRCADGVVFCATDNTMGYGDESGLYAGTHVASVALMSRFPVKVAMSYLPVDVEAQALANHTRAPLPACRKLADLVSTARRMPEMAGTLISLRHMIAFIRVVQKGFGARHAFNVSMLSGMPPAERATMEGLIDLTWDQFDALMRGGKAPKAPVAPSNSPASKAFAD